MSLAETIPGDGTDGLQQILKKAAVHYTTVGDLAYSVLRQAILSGVLGPGQQLRQDALAEALGVSRLPIRSALQQLASDGLIELRPHRGATVSTLTPEQIRNIYEARKVLETYVLRKAIETMTRERLAELESLAAKLDAEPPGDGFLEARMDFYRSLYGAAENPLIVSMIEKLRSDVGRFWLRRRVAHGHEPEHARLVRYIHTRDAEGASRWLEDHLSQVATELAMLVQNVEAND
jgi:DNA-binding GntR family transcriptional regulator